jgi:hypothetical protein
MGYLGKILKELLWIIVVTCCFLLAFVIYKLYLPIQRESPDSYAIWASLPVSIFVQDGCLKEPVQNGVNLLNTGLKREVYVVRNNPDASIQVFCDGEHLPSNLDAYASTNYESGVLMKATVAIRCNRVCDNGSASIIIAHELYHALGFMTPGLGHSRLPLCLSFPHIHQYMRVCGEMRRDFDTRYGHIEIEP